MMFNINYFITIHQQKYIYIYSDHVLVFTVKCAHEHVCEYLRVVRGHSVDLSVQLPPLPFVSRSLCPCKIKSTNHRTT